MTQLSNQFAQSPQLGQLDMAFNTTTISCQVDTTEAGTLVPGQSVKLVDSAGGVPKVVACDSDADTVFGFINYQMLKSGYVAGDAVEISTGYGNVMYLRATAAIARGVLLKQAVASTGGVATAVNGSGSKIVGWALDKAAADGDLIRVFVNAPSFFLA